MYAVSRELYARRKKVDGKRVKKKTNNIPPSLKEESLADDQIKKMI